VRQKADAAIAAMVGSVIATALVPAQVNWALTASAMSAGVCAIGLCYGVELSKGEAWMLVRQFISAGGMWYGGMIIGSKLLSALICSTGIGYAPAVGLDASASAALAFSIGAGSKAWFEGERDKQRLAAIVQSAFQQRKG
jgi:hypothetical protein